MEETTVRQQLDEIREALRKNELEHEVLINLLKGYEGWLRLRGSSIHGHQQALPLLPATEIKAGSKPKDTISVRGAVLHVLKDARGAELHAKEIWLRVQALGSRTSSKNPVAIIDLTCYSLQEAGVQKVGPRLWRWHEPSDTQTT